MDRVQGIINQVRIHEEEGRTDWLLALSKPVWFLTWLLFPASLFRFLLHLLGPWQAVAGLSLLLVVLRIAGPSNLVMLDELLCRIAPSLRSAIRFGLVRVYDFRLIDESGQSIACILRGDLIGTSPMTGDHVHLLGQIRQGTLIVKKGTNLTTNSTLAAKPSRSGWIFLTTIGIAGILGLYMTGRFDPWIHDWAIALGNLIAKGFGARG